jgi:hypothetical protein
MANGVPQRFWKSGTLPNPAFDAVSTTQLDHAGTRREIL